MSCQRERGNSRRGRTNRVRDNSIILRTVHLWTCRELSRSFLPRFTENRKIWSVLPVYRASTVITGSRSFCLSDQCSRVDALVVQVHSLPFPTQATVLCCRILRVSHRQTASFNSLLSAWKFFHHRDPSAVHKSQQCLIVVRVEAEFVKFADKWNWNFYRTSMKMLTSRWNSWFVRSWLKVVSSRWNLNWFTRMWKIARRGSLGSNLNSSRFR